MLRTTPVKKSVLLYRIHRFRLSAAILCCMCAIKPLSCAAMTLTPDSIAIIVNGNDPNSWAIGKLYAKVRAIPPDHLIVLNLPVGQETISSDLYRVRIARAIRQILKMRHLRRSINCLITTYGIPLRVGPDAGGPHTAAELVVVRFDLGRSLKSLHAGTAQLNQLGIENAAPSRSPIAAPPMQSSTTPAAMQHALLVFQQALTAAASRMKRLEPAQRTAAMAKLLPLMQKYVGPAGLLQILHVNPDTPNAAAARAMLARNRRVLRKDMRVYRQLALAGESRRNLAKMRKLQQECFGVTGLARELISEEASLTTHRGNSALDSDLMMLWRGKLRRGRWFLNPMDLRNWTANATANHPRVMMVCRLDAPTPAMVKRMIRVSLSVEKTGLRGVAYFDARGLHTYSPYESFDHDLRVTARYIKANSNMKVVLEDTPAFLQAKNCPDEAVYCGWYSLQHYLDSCQWLPGSVAYHVASFELSTLHTPGTPDWCPNLIAHGVCGTLGATDEPYLFAFPLPSEFFPLLLSGKFTQGEVYYMTTPVIGWRMAFVGDPLYNPFKHHPYIKAATLKKNPLLAKAFLEFPQNPAPPHSSVGPNR